MFFFQNLFNPEVFTKKIYFKGRCQGVMYMVCALRLDPHFAVRLAAEKNFRKQPPRGVLSKRFSENMQEIYTRTPCQNMISIKLQNKFNETTFRYGCSPVNLPHIFTTPFLKNTSGRLLLNFYLQLTVAKMRLRLLAINIFGHSSVATQILRLQLTLQIQKLKY